MPLIKDGQLTADSYQVLADEDSLRDGDILVSAARYLAAPQDFARHAGRVGIVWPNNKRIEELAPHIAQLALVALVFPKFRDGRAYSQARILREQYGFTGELRAVGEILRDQFLFFIRSGFDSLEVKKESDAHVFAEVLNRYSVFYQPAADGRAGTLRARIAKSVGRAAPQSKTVERVS